MADNAVSQNKPSRKTTMARLVVWSVWFSSGVMVLILLGAIVVTLLGEPTLSHNNGTSVTESTTHSNDEELTKLIMQLHNRKGYSNPTPSPDDDDEEITRKPRRRRPLKRIDKDFDPNKSYVIRHPNGTLSFVFPTDSSSSTTSRPITISATSVDPISLKSRLDTNDTNDVPDSTVPPEDEYPTAFVNEIMHNHSTSFEGAFGEDVVIQDGDVLNTRFDEDIEYLCENVVELKRLKSGETRDKTNVMIVNTDDFIQGVRIETCRFPGEPCKFCEFDTECRQTYHYRTLVAVDKRTNKPYKEQIKLPSSCKCGRRLT